ncbi:hypothetical protein ABW19_dt0208519 [Dactylella cylindrospora]|nr:hypothetical protein ABW19_dt0208519 [Dactylella cylindrospora]
MDPTEIPLYVHHDDFLQMCEPLLKADPSTSTPQPPSNPPQKFPHKYVELHDRFVYTDKDIKRILDLTDQELKTMKKLFHEYLRDFEELPPSGQDGFYVALKHANESKENDGAYWVPDRLDCYFVPQKVLGFFFTRREEEEEEVEERLAEAFFDHRVPVTAWSPLDEYTIAITVL